MEVHFGHVNFRGLISFGVERYADALFLATRWGGTLSRCALTGAVHLPPNRLPPLREDHRGLQASEIEIIL